MNAFGRGGVTSDDIRADIEQTRERLGETVEALGAQLNPSHLTQRVKDSVRDATIGRVQTMANKTKERVADGGRGIANVIRENPLPAAMVAAGIGWMLLNNQGKRHDYRPEYIDSASEEPNTAKRVVSGAVSATEGIASKAQDVAQDVADKAKSTAHDVADTVKTTAQDVAETVKTKAQDVAYQAKRATYRVEDKFEESPIALGAFAAALGLAVGLAVPSSRKESEVMGGARDELFGKAREQISETTDKVEKVVERATPEVETVIRDVAREEGLAR